MNTKKILRSAKQYYHEKMEVMFQYKKCKRQKGNKFVTPEGVQNNSWFLVCIDRIVNSIFPKDLLDLFGTT